MQQLETSVFHTVVRWHKLSEMKNEFTSHNLIVLAIFVPKIIEFSENLTKLWQKKLTVFFWQKVYFVCINKKDYA